MLKVFAQAPIPAQPSECPFYDPAAGDHDKALGARGPTGDLQVPSARLFDPGDDGFITSISPDQLQATPAIVDTPLYAHKEFRQEDLPSRTVGDASTMHYHQQEQPQDVHHDMAFAAIDLLVDIGPALFPAFGRLDALAIDNGRTGRGQSARLLPDGRDQRRIQLLPQPAMAPAPVIPIGGSGPIPNISAGTNEQSPTIAAASETRLS